MLPFRLANCGEAGPCCEYREPDAQEPCVWEVGADVVPAWFLKMLSSKFFTPCERHSSLKKNEVRCRYGECVLSALCSAIAPSGQLGVSRQRFEGQLSTHCASIAGWVSMLSRVNACLKSRIPRHG